MKKLQTYLSGIVAVLLLAALGACADDDKTLSDVYLETDASYYSANARGLTYNGEEVVTHIQSNTYWDGHLRTREPGSKSPGSPLRRRPATAARTSR